MIARRTAVGLAVSVALAASMSCEPIEPRPLSEAPLNRCPQFPCERYEPGTRTAARCRPEGKCEIQTAGNRPEFPFWIVVHVPETSFSAPGGSYVFVADERGEPAFKTSPTPGQARRCTPPRCLQIGGTSAVVGSYTVTRQASIDVGYPLAEGTSIPVRVVYEPIGNDQQEAFPVLPLDVLFSSSRLTTVEDGVLFTRAVPFGRYRRVLFPQPPFDRWFPPTADDQNIKSNTNDRFVLGQAPPAGKLLDDPTGASQTATVTRADGLDGWRVWLADFSTERRISVIQTLSGASATVRLHTTGETVTTAGGGTALRDNVDVVVAPPQTFAAVPRFVSTLFGGQGLSTVAYPAIPPPVTVNGVVAQPTDPTQANQPDKSTLFGYAATVSFRGTEMVTRGEGGSTNKLLRYDTTVKTDDRGRFATVLPPGIYDVTIEPAIGTGFAKFVQPVIVDRASTLVLQPPRRTLVKGRVFLTDERPLSEAEVLATPDPAVATESAKPRPARTRTGADGRFSIEVDQGPYIFTVVPKAGTDFPRVVTLKQIPAGETVLPDIRVPAPTRLSFQLADPSLTSNAVAHAIVRVLARVADADGDGTPPGTPPGGVGGTARLATRERPPIEIGSAMTDTQGNVEILLAHEPR